MARRPQRDSRPAPSPSFRPLGWPPRPDTSRGWGWRRSPPMTRGLRTRLRRGVSSIEGVRLLGPVGGGSDPVLGLAAFVVDGVHPHDVGQVFDDARDRRARRPPLCPAATREARGSELRLGLPPRSTRPTTTSTPARGPLRGPADSSRSRGRRERPRADVPAGDHRSRAGAPRVRAGSSLPEGRMGESHQVNPVCGDEVRLRVVLDGEQDHKRQLGGARLLDLAGVDLGASRPGRRRDTRRGIRTGGGLPGPHGRSGATRPTRRRKTSSGTARSSSASDATPPESSAPSSDGWPSRTPSFRRRRRRHERR